MSNNRGTVNISSGTVKSTLSNSDIISSNTKRGEFFKNIDIDKIEISGGTTIIFTSTEAKIRFNLKAESLAKMINSILEKYFEPDAVSIVEDSHNEELKNYKTYDGIEEANY